MGQRFQHPVTIGDLQDELLAVIESGKPVDHVQVRHVNGILDELKKLFAGRMPEPQKAEVEREISSMVRGEIDKVLLKAAEDEEQAED